MALARWKDLCIDAVDASRVGRFWGDLLGLAVEPLDDGDVRLSGPTPQHRVWVNTVPEPVTVKQRVHLDVHVASVADALAIGATPEDVVSFRWKTLRDPEGGELCVFERDVVPDYRLYEIAVDAVEPRAIAQWWAEVLGATYGVDEEHGWAWAEQIPGAPFDCLTFSAVPEPKTVKNRIHWDVVTADEGLLVERGARVLRPRDEEIDWTVLADPEGNEFCAFLPMPG